MTQWPSDVRVDQAVRSAERFSQKPKLVDFNHVIGYIQAMDNHIEDNWGQAGRDTVDYIIARLERKFR